MWICRGKESTGIDLDIIKGEIFGIGGLAGQGKLGIPNGIMGLYPAEGEVIINGKTMNLSNLGEALHNDVAFVSEDRKASACFWMKVLSRILSLVRCIRTINFLKKSAG